MGRRIARAPRRTAGRVTGRFGETYSAAGDGIPAPARYTEERQGPNRARAGADRGAPQTAQAVAAFGFTPSEEALHESHR